MPSVLLPVWTFCKLLFSSHLYLSYPGSQYIESHLWFSYLLLWDRDLIYVLANIEANIVNRLFGYDQGVMGGLLSLDSFVKVFPEIDAVHTTVSYANILYPQSLTCKVANGYTKAQVNHVSTIQGISVASYNVGCFFGAVTTIFVGDLLGRRKTIFIGSAIMVVGAALQCSAFTLGHFIAGRVITGFGNGMNTSTVPTWQSETSKSHKRGKLVMIEGAMITGGICLSYVSISYLSSYLVPY